MTYRSFFSDKQKTDALARDKATGATKATFQSRFVPELRSELLREKSYTFITSVDIARAHLIALAGRQVAFDLETTGLDPLIDKARLLSIAPIGGGETIVIDLYAIGGLSALSTELRNLNGVAHNATFDLAFLTRAGAELALTDCTQIAAHIVGVPTGSLSLKAVAERFLVRTIDKSLQSSQWGGKLTDDQITYAAQDAEIVRDLWHVLLEQIKRQGSEPVYKIVRNAIPAVVQMHLAGTPFDQIEHAKFVEESTDKLERLSFEISSVLSGLKPTGNDFQTYLTDALGGQDSERYTAWPRTTSGKKLSTTRDHLFYYLHLLDSADQKIVSRLILPYLELDTMVKSFGAKLGDLVHSETRRLHPQYHLTGTATGRLSSSRPNIQGFPRDQQIRRLMRAPEGRTFVLADYNAMELRVAAQIAREERLIASFQNGDDPHRLTAALILKKSANDVTKEERQLAKAVNFGLLFGQGAKGLANYAAKTYGVTMSKEDAAGYREAWFDSYPSFYNWQTSHNRRCSANLSVKTPSGRIRKWAHHDWATANGYRSTEAYNTPIQGGAAECILVAMAYLVQQLRELQLDAILIASVHDELVVECAINQSDMVKNLLGEAMMLGFTSIFPDAPTRGLVEARLSLTWSKD